MPEAATYPIALRSYIPRTGTAVTTVLPQLQDDLGKLLESNTNKEKKLAYASPNVMVSRSDSVLSIPLKEWEIIVTRENAKHLMTFLR